MISIELFRKNPELIRKSEKNRFKDPKLVDKVIELDKKWRASTYKLQSLRAKRNKLSLQINELKKKGKSAKKEIIESKKTIKDLEKLEKQTAELLKQRDEYRYQIGNILHKDVPIGKDEKANKVLRKVGKLSKFGFKPKNHLELAEDLGILDAKRGAKVSGHGFFYLKGELAILDLALQKFAIDFLMKKGFTLV